MISNSNENWEIWVGPKYWLNLREGSSACLSPIDTKTSPFCGAPAVVRFSSACKTLFLSLHETFGVMHKLEDFEFGL